MFYARITDYMETHPYCNVTQKLSGTTACCAMPWPKTYTVRCTIVATGTIDSGDRCGGDDAAVGIGGADPLRVDNADREGGVGGVAAATQR